MRDLLGYAFLREHLNLHVLPVQAPAFLAPSAREIRETVAGKSIPPWVAPKSEDPLEHLQFAIKHEGIDLSVLSQAIRKIAPASLRDALREKPNSRPLRILGLLWEHCTREKMTDIPPVTTSSAPLFDPGRYLVADPEKPSNRWRIQQNGLGTLDYLVTVRLTPEIQSLLQRDLLQEVRDALANMNPVLLERTVSWAYLSDTKHSFAIERERLPEPKSLAYAQLLWASLQKPLAPWSEDALCALQSGLLNHPMDRATGWRTGQNWLQNGLRGALGVQYVPPGPEYLPRLMQDIGVLADTLGNRADPLVAASIVSFAFVYAHPFWDGNGRMSRYLFHRTLAQSEALEKGWILPVSIAMERNENRYLSALQSFSAPSRGMWEVCWIDGDQFSFRFLAEDDSLYRYWDATKVVQFGLEMGQESWDHDLLSEARFLARYDAMEKVVREQIDLRQSVQSFLIRHCLEQNGRISNNRRKQFSGQVPEEAFAVIEQAWRETGSDALCSPEMQPSAEGEEDVKIRNVTPCCE